MTTLREAAQQALEALEYHVEQTRPIDRTSEAITALRDALAEPEEFDHGIGDDRFKVVRGAYWWHVLIGDSPTKRGKFHTQAGAEEMAALLLREFRNGAFVQHRAALAEPVQEPVAWAVFDIKHGGSKTLHWPEQHSPNGDPSQFKAVPLYPAPPQRKPLTEEEIEEINRDLPLLHMQASKGSVAVVFARAIERVHGITGDKHGS